MDKYFIEFRIMGSMKYDIRSIVYDIRQKSRLKGDRPIPHISIVYNPTPKNGRRDERRLMNDFNTICSKYPLMQFQFGGFGSFPDNGTAIIKIIPTPKMVDLRWELICRLRGYCVMHSIFDKNINDWEPHAAIALKLDSSKLRSVMNHLGKIAQPRKHYYLTRATLLKNSKIFSEYDFALRRSLTRGEALNRRILAKTEAIIRQKVNGKVQARTKSQPRMVHGPLQSLKRALQNFLKSFK